MTLGYPSLSPRIVSVVVNASDSDFPKRIIYPADATMAYKLAERIKTTRGYNPPKVLKTVELIDKNCPRTTAMGKALIVGLLEQEMTTPRLPSADEVARQLLALAHELDPFAYSPSADSTTSAIAGNISLGTHL